MFHALSYVFFAFVAGHWINFELSKKRSLTRHARWIVAAFLLGVFGSMLSELYGGNFGNFLLHSVGGGMAAGCLYMYLLRTFEYRVNWRVNVVLFFLFVSALGVVNELAEYMYELVGLGIMSFDTHDTWRDFVANTSGGYLLLVSFVIVSKLTQRVYN